MNRVRQKIQQDQQIKKWEVEMENLGYIEDIGKLFPFLQNLDMEKDENKKLASQLLSYAAISISAKEGKNSLALAWMEKAKEWNFSNTTANEYLAAYQWKENAEMLDILSFPPIRETDNRQARRQSVLQYIDVCQKFIIKAEDYLDQFSKMTLSIAANKENKLFPLYQKIIHLLKAAIEETTLLLKAASEYEKSMVGAFSTAVYYDEMKIHLNKIDEIKSKWSILFEENKEKENRPLHALDELNSMIGLDSVKKRVNDFYQFFKYQKRRKELGFQTKDDFSLNMIISGNPGTGKTTLARLFAKIYFELGVLPRDEVIEVDRSQLVGAFVGQTEENVRSAVEKALGGVLFIDEAYNLQREGQTGNDYGQTVIDTLVSLMTSNEFGGKFSVILAGYPEEMRQFLDKNPGLRSRFPMSNNITLPNYSNDELILIGEKVASENDYFLTEEARIALENRIEKERVDESFGNARTVRHILLDAIFHKGAHVNNTKDKTDILYYSFLDKEDFLLQTIEKKENPLNKLNHLIGLTNVKEEVQSIVSFVKMQKIRQEAGLPVVPIQLHSVFTGNPGTGKTTVAKIYAELLKECGLLKRGHLIITSRADFVAGYVGQTAVKTKRKIREALGGVLFIDEAYSLLGQTAGDFGKEVIDTLVDEMTKHNENLVVVLAGYPNEMKFLLDSNPGLQSRFKKFLHFNDYTANELLQIMKGYGKQFDFQLTTEAVQFILSKLTNQPVDGNGRFAINLMNEAIQSQALRIMTNNIDASILEVATVIHLEDLQHAWNKIGKAVEL